MQTTVEVNFSGVAVDEWGWWEGSEIVEANVGQIRRKKRARI